jgi:hypothetical protein
MNYAHLSASVIRRTNGRGLVTLKQRVISDIGGGLDRNLLLHFSFLQDSAFNLNAVLCYVWGLCKECLCAGWILLHMMTGHASLGRWVHMWGFGDFFRREKKQSLSVSPPANCQIIPPNSLFSPSPSSSDRSVNPPKPRRSLGESLALIAMIVTRLCSSRTKAADGHGLACVKA